MFSLLRGARQTAGLLLLLAACATPVFALAVPVPEIDPGSMSSALALLIGGIFLMKDGKHSF